MIEHEDKYFVTVAWATGDVIASYSPLDIAKIEEITNPTNGEIYSKITLISNYEKSDIEWEVCLPIPPDQLKYELHCAVLGENAHHILFVFAEPSDIPRQYKYSFVGQFFDQWKQAGFISCFAMIANSLMGFIRKPHPKEWETTHMAIMDFEKFRYANFFGKPQRPISRDRGSPPTPPV